MPATATYPEPVLRRVEVPAPIAPLDAAEAPLDESTTKIATEHVSIRYGDKVAVRDVSLQIRERSIMALLGPSGSGKSTFLRCFNRMNDLIPGAKVEGQVCLDGENVTDPDVSVVELRRRVGMVFQRPNPFPMSIYENVAYGPRRHGLSGKAQLDDLVERCLRQAALWGRSRTTCARTRTRCRAASSSDCASRARLQPVPRSS